MYEVLAEAPDYCLVLEYLEGRRSRSSYAGSAVSGSRSTSRSGS